METAFYIGALLTGLAGSVHCVGMCGPLALAVHGMHGRSFSSLFFYFFGKTLTYAVLGAIAGVMGSGIAAVGFSQGLSIATGIALLLVAFNQIFRPVWWHQNTIAVSVQNQLSKLTGWVLAKGGRWSGVMMGMLNGLLPCGLVYLGMIGSAATGNVLHGALYMTLMGAGTIPAMLIFVGGIFAAGRATQLKLQKLLPYAIALVGVLLVLRGAGMGIPFISPALANEAANANAVGCH